MKVAVVGTGSVGRRHLANLIALGHDVIGVSEHARHDAIEIDGQRVPCVPAVDAVLDAGVDAVVVANPTAQHVATAEKAIAAGVDLYLEKPAAMNATASAALAGQADEAGVVVAVGQQLRFHPLVEALGAMIDRQEVGTLLAVDANWGEHLADYHPGEDYRTGYAARRDLGGGVLLTQIHLPDLLWSLFGPLSVRSASGGQRSDLEIDVEDTVSFLATTAEELSVYGHLDYLQRPKRSTITVTGTGGRVVLDLQEHSLTTTMAASDAQPSVRLGPTDRNELFLTAMRDFLDARTERRQPRCSLAQATEVLGLVDAIRSSM